MTGQDFQDRLDAVVEDLQTAGKGRSVNIMFRGGGNSPQIMPLSSDANGVINSAQLSAIQTFVDDLKSYADDYEFFYAPVKTALEALKTAQTPHESLFEAATTARKALNDVLEADANYQAAKNALDTARANQSFIDALAEYKVMNTSENYAELQNAKGKYA